jgi:cell wall-associated NlpC family hydrolase
MNLKKNLGISLCFLLFSVIFVGSVSAQQRARVVPNQTNQTQNRESRPLHQNPNPTEIVKKTVFSSPLSAPVIRPTLTNQIVVNQNQVAQSLVKKTSSSQPLNAPKSYAAVSGRMAYGSGLKSKLMFGINARLGIPYLYGSTGPNRYDCSGFIWSVFNDAGINFERSSAKTFWEEFEPVEGDERFQFGTLVFFNKLGHVGIVVDENGFYHASSSKGITYSTFKGYWGKRIVGYRRIPTNQTTNIAVEQTKNQ